MESAVRASGSKRCSLRQLTLKSGASKRAGALDSGYSDLQAPQDRDLWRPKIAPNETQGVWKPPD